MKGSVTCGFICPPLAGKAESIIDSLRAIEAAAEGERFAFQLGSAGKAAVRFTPIPDLPAYIHEQFARWPAQGHLSSVCNRNERKAMTMSFNHYADGHVAGQLGVDIVTINVPLALQPAFGALMGQVGDHLEAYAARYSPWDAGVDMNQVLFPTRYMPPLTDRQKELVAFGFPQYRRDWHPGGWHIPDRIEWLNYWSPQACAALEFPGHPGDLSLFAHARRTPRGAFLLQMTDEPLDLANMDHRTRLKRAYDRFERIWKDREPTAL